MRLLEILFGRRRAAASAPHAAAGEMISLVVLSHSYVELMLDLLRKQLDQIYPGYFLPPRERGTFLVEGSLDGAGFLIQSDIPGAAGMFLLHSVPGPFSAVSNFAAHIADASLRRLAEAQTCWLSIFLMHRDVSPQEGYRFIGSVPAQLAPPDTAVLVHPSRLITIAFTDEVRRELASGGQIFGTAQRNPKGA